MSVSANIVINLTKNDINKSLVLQTIQVLIDANWRLIRNGKISYLPLEDNEFLDYRFGDSIAFEEFVSILRQKELCGEMIALDMFWKETLIGGCFMFYPDTMYKNIFFSISSDRQKMKISNDFEITDFQWYLEKLLPPLNDAFGVEYFSCEEHR